MTCFAYGQTGSGKTFTMEGVQEKAVHDLFSGSQIMREDTGQIFTFMISYFEIYGEKLYDLLNDHQKLEIQEGSNGKFQVSGLKEIEATSADQMLELISYGASVRTTQATASNDTSSRSHAICTISILEIVDDGSIEGKKVEGGKLLLVDLAGSERA